MTPPDLMKKLHDALASWLTEGIHIDAETATILESTWDIQDASDLTRLLADPDDGDAQTALELLFFPTPALSARLERMLGDAMVNDRSQAALIQSLIAIASPTPIGFPDPAERAHVTPPDWLLTTLVHRLRLDHSPAPAIRQAVTHLSDADRLVILVRIRHSRITRDQTDFWVSLINGMDPEIDPVVSLMEEAIPLLETADPDTNRFQILETQKRRLFRAIQTAESFEHQLARQNMETLMLQGVALPTMSVTEARDRMRRIDQICRAAFGRVPVIEPADFVSDSGEYPLGNPPSGVPSDPNRTG